MSTEETSAGSFIEVDLSAWVPLLDEDMGTKRKRWYVDPASDEQWLFKPATFNHRPNGTRYRKGDDWAERVVTAIADHLGIPAARTELAVLDGPDWGVGTISLRVVTDDETLVHGLEMLDEIGVVRTSSRDRAGYTLSAVADVLDSVDPPTGHEFMSAWDWFVGYLVLDALVGNTDRHQENWAAIEDGRRRRLAPTFDHASSLGFLLDDETRGRRLIATDRNQTVAAYAAKATSKFEHQPRLIEIALRALELVSADVARHWLSKVETLESIEIILGRVPATRLSPAAHEFASVLFAQNRQLLLLQGTSTL